MATNWQRTYGRDGEGGGPGLVVVVPLKPEVLEGKSDHRRERVMVQAPPASALEEVEAE